MAFTLSETEHKYPENIHVLSNPYLSSLLTQLCDKNSGQPLFNDHVKTIYKEMMIQVLNREWPTTEVSIPTRMSDTHPECYLNSVIFDRVQKAVCVDIARAGMLPSQVIFDMLNHIAEPEGIRQDHVFASRVTDSEQTVTHTHLSSSKVGGDVEDAVVFMPDPMGATGNSLVEVVDFYKNKVPGQAKRFVSIHLIITPEFIRRVTDAHPDVKVYACRVDRGLSEQKVLDSGLGEFWAEEKGLNDNQYIVPGAGGVGEIINNSYV